MSPLIDAWDEAHREFAIALQGIPGEDLWKRPHPRLLSVGELAGHVAYWEAVWTMAQGSDSPPLDGFPVKSALLDHACRYYTHSVSQPFEIDMSPSQILDETRRIYEAARATAAQRGKDEPYPGQWGTWGNLIQYQVFHVAYHAGQAYSARHLLGHETEDN